MDLAGPSVPQVLLRDSTSSQRETLWLSASNNWWTAPTDTAMQAAMEASWIMPLLTSKTMEDCVQVLTIHTLDM